MSKLKVIVIAFFLLHVSASYVLAQTENITRQETLRGSITPEREWWDLLHYNLQVEFLPETRWLKGSNTITFKTLKPGNKMQIDLQPPLAITKVTHGDAQHIGSALSLVADFQPRAIYDSPVKDRSSTRKKIHAELGYEPRVRFDAGLAEVVQWYRDNAWWWKPLLGTEG